MVRAGRGGGEGGDGEFWIYDFRFWIYAVVGGAIGLWRVVACRTMSVGLES